VVANLSCLVKSAYFVEMIVMWDCFFALLVACDQFLT
jgi:hypothetical protein